MPPLLLDPLLTRLERLSRERLPGAGREVARLLVRLGRARIDDAPGLIRLHEVLLFLRAYPHNREVLKASERLLAKFSRRVERCLEDPSFDLPALVAPEVSGIAGVPLSIDWGYDLVRHLAARHGRQVEIDWEVAWNEPALSAVLKRLSPAFEDAGYVEYPVPTRRWIQQAKGKKQSDLAWLLARFAGWQIPEREKAALFESLHLYIEWKVGASRGSRSRCRVPAEAPFFHSEPLLKRGDVSLLDELENGGALPTRKLSPREGDELLALARDAMAVRSRELHGFNLGDPKTVVRAEAGRGVVFYLWGVSAERRLPLLAYHCGLMVKNGVPMGYTESLGFFERTEVGLNLFYSFREGESAWIYARLLRLLRQRFGLTVFSVDPYQIGHHNQEAIDSGAFWFYRKLGFRPVVPELRVLVEREEKKIASSPGYRTSKAVLKKLATGHLLLEAPSTLEPGAWDRFRVGNLGLVVERARETGTGGGDTSVLERLLSRIPDLGRWPEAEKVALKAVVAAKTGADETRYLRLLRNHPRLRRGLLRLGAQLQPGGE